MEVHTSKHVATDGGALMWNRKCCRWLIVLFLGYHHPLPYEYKSIGNKYIHMCYKVQCSMFRSHLQIYIFIWIRYNTHILYILANRDCFHLRIMNPTISLICGTPNVQDFPNFLKFRSELFVNTSKVFIRARNKYHRIRCSVTKTT